MPRPAIGGVNNTALSAARTNEGARTKRHPWMSDDDYRQIVALRQLGLADLAREYERLAHHQADGDRTFRDTVVPESVIGNPGVLEELDGKRRARWLYGCGGGRAAATH